MQIPSNFSAIESIIKTGGMISLLIFAMDTRLRVPSLAVPPRFANQRSSDCDACRVLWMELDDWSLLKCGLCNTPGAVVAQ
jgi:hypothetical protein